MVRRFTRPLPIPTAPVHPRTVFRAEELEGRDTPSLSGMEDLLSQPFATAPAQTAQVARPLLREPRGRYAVGTDGGGAAQVNVYDAKTNALIGTLNPFGRNYTGGLTVATGDLTGDGVEDVIVGAGRGGTPMVKVYDGVTLKELGTLMAYSNTFSGGVSVAVGDVDGDGRADLVTGAGVGSAPHVKMFRGTDLFPTAGGNLNANATAAKSFFAFDASQRAGITVAVGDLNRDGYGDITVGIGTGTGGQVKAFSGKDDSVIASLAVFPPSYTGGIGVAVGDVDGDGKADLIVSQSGPGGGTVAILDGTTGALKKQYNPLGNANGVRVALQDTDGDGVKELVAVSGSGAPRVKVLTAMTGAARRDNPGFMPWFTRGLTVG